MGRFLLGVLVTLFGIAGVVYLGLSTGLVDAGVDNKPLPFERWAARTSLHATLDREAPKGPNPIALTDENLIAGIQLYGTHCVVCHGTAKGDASATAIAKGENPAPPQLASDGVEDDPEGVTFWKVKHGIRWTGMPGWAKTLSDQQIWTLALFLKHMDKLPPATEEAWQKLGQ